MLFPGSGELPDGLSQVDAEYVHLIPGSVGRTDGKPTCLVKIPAAVPAPLRDLRWQPHTASAELWWEVNGSQEGLGYYLLRVKNGYMLDKVFACVAVIIFLSLCMNGLIRLYEYLGNAVSEKTAVI